MMRAIAVCLALVVMGGAIWLSCVFFYLGVEGGWLFFGFLFLSSLLLPGNGSDEEDPSAHQEDG